MIARNLHPARISLRGEKFSCVEAKFLRGTLVTFYYRVEFGFPSKNRRKQIAKISVFLRTVYTGFARKWSQRKKKHLAHEKNACVRRVCSGLYNHYWNERREWRSHDPESRVITVPVALNPVMFPPESTFFYPSTLFLKKRYEWRSINQESRSIPAPWCSLGSRDGSIRAPHYWNKVLISWIIGWKEIILDPSYVPNIP